MAKSLFVGSLKYETKENDVTELFSEIGSVVSVRLKRDPDTGNALFAFVEMSNDEEAQTAFDTMDKAILLGRPIHVDWAKEKPKTPRTDQYPNRRRNRD